MVNPWSEIAKTSLYPCQLRDIEEPGPSVETGQFYLQPDHGSPLRGTWNIHLDPSSQQEFKNPSLTMGSRGWYPWWDCPWLRGSSWLLLLWPNLFSGAQASRRGPTARRGRGHRGRSHSQAMDRGWPSSACRWDRLGAWGQGWWWLLLLLVHLLEVLLPSPHLRILQLLHVEGLPVSQELLPLILQLPAPSETVTGVQQMQRQTPCPLLLSSDKPKLSF